MAGYKKANPNHNRPRGPGVDAFSSLDSRSHGTNDGGSRSYKTGSNGFGRNRETTKSGVSSRRGPVRSPSPYRRSRSISPSPPRFSRKRSPSPYRRRRSPSPYRHVSRSPSPYHNSKGKGRGHGPKRSVSPSTEDRPMKRVHRGHNGNNGYHTQNTVEQMNSNMAQHSMNNSRSTIGNLNNISSQPWSPNLTMLSTAENSPQPTQMNTEIVDAEDDLPEPFQEDKVPTEEEREKKRARWAALRAQSASQSTTPAPGSPATISDLPPKSPMITDKQTGPEEQASPAAESTSAADYDPTEDDRTRIAHLKPTAPTTEVPAPPKKKKKEIDMFASDFEDDDDDEDEEVPKEGRILDVRLLDNWDDPDGYYKIIHNERIGPTGRYKVTKSLGKGVFANVVQAEDNELESHHKDKLVAIKIIRRNTMMRIASQKEASFVRALNENDPEDRHHIVRLFGTFDHKGHLCIIFEHLDRNLRDVLKELTGGHGVSFRALVSFARQMFQGLLHLRNHHVLHADLKPDNILVSHDKKTIKIADFGTAVDIRDQFESSEEMASRFYRAPEVILGMSVGHPIDMWAIGCTLFEMWTGKILFAGERNNNGMLGVMLKSLGWPSEKYLQKGLWTHKYFEPGPPIQFLSETHVYAGAHRGTITEIRKVGQGKDSEKHQGKNREKLGDRVRDGAKGITNPPSQDELTQLTNLLQGCLNWYPEKRISPDDALKHNFFRIQQMLATPRPVIKPIQAGYLMAGKRK